MKIEKALYKKYRAESTTLVFFHPDYTVGTGVSPVQLLSQVADCTASGDLHPALKNIHFYDTKNTPLPKILQEIFFTLLEHVSTLCFDTLVRYFASILLELNPSQYTGYGTEQDNRHKEGAKVFDHEIKYRLSFKGSILSHNFRRNTLYTDYSDHQ